jgi:hypothetical protein
MKRQSSLFLFSLPSGYALRKLLSLLSLRARPIAAIPRPGKRIGHAGIH